MLTSLQDYTFTKREGLVYPAQIGIVVATDEDSGQFGNITYYLTGVGAEYFRIDPLNVSSN